MGSFYWAKIFIEMLDDPKVARLSDRLWRRFVECILLAKELDAGGELPPIADMAWRLRTDDATLAGELAQLATLDLMAAGEVWTVTNFTKRQGAVTDAERMRNMRVRKMQRTYYEPSDEPVTNRNAEKEIDKEKEAEEDARARAAAAAAIPDNSEIASVFTAYQDNIGNLTPHISEQIGSAIDELSPAWVLAAIKLAVERNKRSWRYIAGILKSWEAQGHMDHPDQPATGNGSASAADAAWQRVLSQIKGGRWTLPLDGPELATVQRMGGWPALKNSLERDIPFIMQRFIKEYGHGAH